MKEVTVLGAGIVGLTTALELQRNFPSLKLIVVADKFNEETTSDGAAGIFRPSNSFSGPDPDTTKKWIKDSYDFYSNLLSQDCGVSEVSGYIYSNIKPSLVRNSYLEGLVSEYRAANEDELIVGSTTWKYGSYFTTLLIECRQFLPWALERLKTGGCCVLKRKIETLNEFCGKCDILVNCTGLGAQDLCRDPHLVPIRGQVFKVKADWLDKFYYADYDTYIIPNGRSGLATIGGSRHYESYSTQVCPFDGQAIMSRAVDFLPRLANAQVESVWVGLRPHRHEVRVDWEQVADRFHLVHNYGHGGYGVTTAPGTAAHAVSLVRQLLTKGKL